MVTCIRDFPLDPLLSVFFFGFFREMFKFFSFVIFLLEIIIKTKKKESGKKNTRYKDLKAKDRHTLKRNT